MRSYIFGFTAAVMALVTLPSPVGAELPGRKSGLWESVTTGAGIPDTRIKECVDQTADKAAIQEPKGAVGQKCQILKVGGSPDSFQATVTCDMSGTTMLVTSTGSGDFSSAVTYTVNTTFDPPLMGQSSRTIKIDAKYVGECPAGSQPGDVEISNGMKFGRADQERLAKQAEGLMANPEMQAAIKRAAGAQ